ncbi:MAG: DNRLRE domain-containing protein [candidate division KSB1 bacterium]|nr:DNRLRE domain-containing protein [candidate division KSB1 bacterium]MDZ7367206.1 DNRLRE domain-containing protein [candidate division KSB1 bacterium]MDZ7405311.1 DNRLRE domain-containing protein [candidate division KSB1 bacterium]
MRNPQSKRSPIAKIFSLIIKVTTVTGLIAPTASAQTQIQIPARKDNTLYESSTGAFSNGAGQHFFVGSTARAERRRGLLAFDIAGNIPAGSTIHSVTLRLHMSRTISGVQFVKLHRVLADWGEGSSNAASQEGSGAASTTGDATWIHRFFNTVFWTTAGGDFAATASDSQMVSSIGFYTWGSTPQMVNDVQSWLNAPSTNFGWLLRGTENVAANSKRFDTRENPDTSVRPFLTVSYTPTVAVKDHPSQPTVFALHENFPNPFAASSFNSQTLFRYELPQQANVKLVIYNLRGEKIRTLIDAPEAAGLKQITWNGANDAGERVASGVYLYRLEAGAFTATRKLMFIR